MDKFSIILTTSTIHVVPKPRQKYIDVPYVLDAIYAQRGIARIRRPRTGDLGKFLVP
jgi:hypothetical protein